MRIGVIGYGYWGPNLVRNFSELEGLDVTWCADLRPERCALAKKRYPSLKVTEKASDVFSDPEVEAVVIGTPVRSHYNLAKQALQKGKHVLIEKPMACTVAECEELIALAERYRLVLMVDHTFIYTSAVRKIKEIIDTGELGELYYFDSVRVNLGLFQHDVDVLWDLAPHDLSILTFLLDDPPKNVSAKGADHTGRGSVDMAYLTLEFERGFIAHFHVNWLSPVKVRQILIGGSHRMLVYDDTEPSEKLRIYDRGVQLRTQEGIYKTLVDYRSGDVWMPKLDLREALSVECEHFVECIQLNRIPLSDGKAGLRVVRLLEAASVSMATGENVKLVEARGGDMRLFAPTGEPVAVGGNGVRA